jgi:3-methyladenine DNA glycosylase AlkC
MKESDEVISKKIKSSLKRLEDKYNKASTENKINFVTKKQSRSVDSFFLSIIRQ